MAIGLDSGQLLNAFLTQAGKRLTEIQGQVDAMQAGENPQLVNQLQELLKQNPNLAKLPTDQILIVIVIMTAFMDTIVANNAAIAKVVPHVEP